MSDRLRLQTVAGLATLLAGLVLLAHPRYFESLTVYPGTGWWFFPMFHAAFTALGAVAVGAGWFLLRMRAPSDRELAILSIATILTAATYAAVLLQLTGADPGVVDGYGSKRALVGGLVAGLFTVGFAVPTRRPRAAGLGVLAVVAPLSFVVLRWATTEGALLGPVVDVFILLTNPAVLGIEHLGIGLLLAAAVLGAGLGVEAAWGRSTRGRSTTASDTDRTADETD